MKIDPSRYAEFKQRKVPSIAEDMEGYSKQLTGYKFKTLEIAGERCILLTDNDIEYVVDEYENIEPPKILVPGSKIIL